MGDKMNKKGITIIELLAAIALLAVILTIAVLSFSSIQKTILNKQRDNLILDIKIASRKYFADTGNNVVYVKDLIEQGYITSDKENAIYDPVTQKSLNCYYVKAENNNELFIEGNCSYENLDNSLVKINYCTSGGCVPNKGIPSSWINDKEIYFGVQSSVEFDDEAYTWIMPLSPDLVDNNMVHKVQIPSSGYINDVYEVIINSNGEEYKASARLKVDIKNPVVSNLKVDDVSMYTQSKTINATIKDSESGLYAYAVTMSKDLPSDDKWNFIDEKQRDISHIAKSNGTYYVWVKDNAGNTNIDNIEDSKVTISTIDRIAPLCTLDGENDTWTSDDVTIIWGCDDNESGCNISYSGGSETFSESAKSVKIDSYTIKDNAGNITNCAEQSANVYIDKTAPYVSEFTITSSNSDYNSKEVKLTISSSDAHSGVKELCIMDVNDPSKCAWKSNITNYTLPSSSYDGKTFTLYAFAKDGVGNISSSKSSTYGIYAACSKTKIKDYGAWGECDKPCGGGTKYRDIYYIDTYFETECPNGSDSTPCNTQSCCSEGTWDCTCAESGIKSCTKNNTCTDNIDTKTEACTGTINDYRYEGCNKYFITTCTNGTCKYTEKNGAKDDDTIEYSSLSTSLGSTCKAPKCGAYITSKSGNIVLFTTSSGCTTTKYRVDSGGCSATKYGTTGFKADFGSSQKCVFVMDNQATATWGEVYKYHSEWVTVACAGTEERNGCYCSGRTPADACKNSNTACAC